MLFSILVFYPALQVLTALSRKGVGKGLKRTYSTDNLFQTDPLKSAARGTPFWICAAISTVFYGLAATKSRSIKIPMMVGFAIFTAGISRRPIAVHDEDTNV